MWLAFSLNHVVLQRNNRIFRLNASAASLKWIPFRFATRCDDMRGYFVFAESASKEICGCFIAAIEYFVVSSPHWIKKKLFRHYNEMFGCFVTVTKWLIISSLTKCLVVSSPHWIKKKLFRHYNEMFGCFVTVTKWLIISSLTKCLVVSSL